MQHGGKTNEMGCCKRVYIYKIRIKCKEPLGTKKIFIRKMMGQTAVSDNESSLVTLNNWQ